MDAIVAMLAILHVGAVYVPLDVSLPTARHAAMVESCKPNLLLMYSATEERVHDLNCEIKFSIPEVCMDAIPHEAPQQVPCLAEPNEGAALLFTSGSTGTPKGILLSEANFVNHLALKTHLLSLGQESVLQQSSLGFDMSMVQMFYALANGGCLVVAGSETRRDPVEVMNLVKSNGISLTIATPSEYLASLHYGSTSLRENAAWRHACMGGEVVSEHLIEEFRRLRSGI